MIEDEMKSDSNLESNSDINKESIKKSKPKSKKISAKKPVAKKPVAAKRAVSKKSVQGDKVSGKSNVKKNSADGSVSKSDGIGLAPPNMLTKVRDDIAPLLIKEFNYKSSMQVPGLTKVTLNIGMGSEAIQNSKSLDAAANDVAIITGQKPIVTRARKSIAAFKLREGMPIGVSVTLRRRKMYEFMERFISSALPRIRDFRGLSRNCFDGRGNCTIGIKEQVIFPEIDYNSIDKLRGLQVIICTSANSDIEGIRFLELLGMPFVKK